MSTSILFGDARREDAATRRWGVVSAGVLHALALAAVLGVFAQRARVVPYRLPGTAEGVRFLTYYSPGSAAPAAVSEAAVRRVKEKPRVVTPAEVAAERPAADAAPTADAGTGSTVASGLGQGDISIALQTFFPYPKPSLASLAHGAKGDVILNAVIDEHGKITGLTLLQGLGSPIDESVIATVKQWSYTPAMRNGVAVPSEQELRFHYERS